MTGGWEVQNKRKSSQTHCKGNASLRRQVYEFILGLIVS